ncbi:thrombopoietin [Nothobranchius furzeri]|uniref:LOC107383964-like protein n=1 Tax=Nothobranchius furzeri TaxID=105023 RepID=A0A9D3BW97_NOTFU|nr:thrombopoietin [Nothobranchius furzeri]KAF7222550.1 putative LOC107383964-like protein [Nothobranchius furzeri]
MKHSSREYFPPDTSLNGTYVESGGAAGRGMALGRLLLLCAVACEVWDTETKPEDFVCSRAARKALNIGPELEIALSECVSSTILSTSFQLPCTQLHVATWETKSDKEKQGDVVASLRLLIEGVRTLRTTAQAGCETVLLQRLENNIQNHLLILTHLQLSGPVPPPSLSCVPPSTRSLRTVLRSYTLLISGKLERFIVNLGDRCTS